MEESIVLQSVDYGTSKILPKESEHRTQELGFECQGSRSNAQFSFKLFDQCFIESELRNVKTGTVNAMAFHVGFLGSNPTSSWSYNRFSIAALAVSFCVIAICLLLKEWLFAAEFLLLLALNVYVVYKSIKKKVVFLSKSASAPLLTFWSPINGGKRLQVFVTALQEKIEKHPLPAEVQILPEETKLLRLASERALLSVEEYEVARKRLLKLYPKKSPSTVMQVKPICLA